MIKASGLAVGYNKKILIDGISFEVKAGEILTLIGPNGSGKSTVLKTLVKELESLGGSISVASKNIFTEKDTFAAKHISMLMTERIHPEMMTVRDVIATGRYPYTNLFGVLGDDDNAKINEAIKGVHCEDIEGRLFNNLSDGQKQRVMLARAICQDTEIIVLDEPVTFLDMFYKLDFFKNIKKLAREKNKTIILSLHELDLVKNISDKVLCLNGKKIVKAGKPEDIFTGGFIQQLYGIKEEEFDCTTATMRWQEPAVKPAFNIEENNTESAKKAKVIMVQGTMSNAGKSLVAAGLCRIFRQDGFRAAPFKSQNMALNSFITKDGLEMSRAQVMQAEAAGMEPDVAMNPILLKPTSDCGSQVIVNGQVKGNMTAREYFAYKKNLIPELLKAFNRLAAENDIIVIEGAGSPAEINLRENDIVNMGLAQMVDAPVLLVGDIDRGGVFAQLYGTVELLEENERKRIKGLIINKFRGDKSLLDSGVNIIEDRCHIPVVGILPYMNLSLEDEDSLSERFSQHKDGIVNIGAIKFPHISNFTDLNVFEQIEGVAVHYITRPEEIPSMDMIVLPGTKNTIADLKWMRTSGIEAAVKKYSDAKIVFGICGGYQMLGKTIYDPDNVEEGGSVKGMELLDCETTLLKNKTRTQVKSKAGQVDGRLQFLSNKKISGYEIHMGKTIVAFGKAFPAGTSFGNVYGSYIHGFFDEGNIAFLICNYLAEQKGAALSENKIDYKAFKEKQYNLLADGIRKNINMEAVYEIIRK